MEKLPIYAYETPKEVEECSISEDLMRSAKIVKFFKGVLLIVVLVIFCFMGITCSYLQLNRRYQKLESKQRAHQNWLQRLKSDNEGGAKHTFAKVSKGVQKIAKSGTQGIKQVVKK